MTPKRGAKDYRAQTLALLIRINAHGEGAALNSHLGRSVLYGSAFGGSEGAKIDEEGEDMSAFELSAHMTIRPGQLEGFKRQAAEIIRLAKEKDTQTLRYDWFITKDGAECEVREMYETAQGLIDHKAHIGPALAKLFEEYADNHFMTFYGEPPAQLIELVKKLRMEDQVQWFSFFKGLD